MELLLFYNIYLLPVVCFFFDCELYVDEIDKTFCENISKI